MINKGQHSNTEIYYTIVPMVKNREIFRYQYIIITNIFLMNIYQSLCNMIILSQPAAGLAISQEIILFPRAVGNNGNIRDLMGNNEI